jgi:hypothetical protein
VIAADWTNGKVDRRAYQGQDTDAVDCNRCLKRLAALA